jgi:hypothetical protein
MDEAKKNEDMLLPLVAFDISPAADTPSTLIVSSVIALAYLISAIFPPLNFITFLLAVGGTILLELLPDNSFSLLSKDIMVLIYPAINQELLMQKLADAESALNGMRIKFENVTDDFDVWKNTNDDQLKEIKADRLRLLYGDISHNTVGDIAIHFSSQYLAGATLSHMAFAATQYLTIMRTYYYHANDLKLAGRSTTPSIDRQDLVLQRLQRDMAVLIDMATKSYKDGLQRLITGASNVPRTWDDYNNYRNTATLTGLDLIALLPYLDPGIYNTGCDVRALNRRLLTLFDTYDNPEQSKDERKNILNIEGAYNRAVPVDQLIFIEFNSCEYRDKAHLTHHAGLFRTRCRITSTDGVDDVRQEGWTGIDPPAGVAISASSMDLRPSGCFALYGQYWNRSTPMFRYVPGIMPVPIHIYAITTLKNMNVLVERGDRDYQRKLFAFSTLTLDTALPVSNFEQSLRGKLNQSSPHLPSKFSERLSDFSTIYAKQRQQYSFLLAWHNKVALKSLLPTADHARNREQNPVQQFHAVRAGSYIRNLHLRIIPGPGFTGGDLVELSAGSSLGFRLINNSNRWFNGFYKVRLWYVRPVRGVSVQVIAIPIDASSLPSVAGETIPGAAPVPDPTNLHFSELLPYTFPGMLIITANVTGIWLFVYNSSLNTSIIIDRLELMYDGFTTRDASSASVSDDVNPDQVSENLPPNFYA